MSDVALFVAVQVFVCCFPRVGSAPSKMAMTTTFAIRQIGTFILVLMMRMSLICRIEVINRHWNAFVVAIVGLPYMRSERKTDMTCVDGVCFQNE